MRLRLLAAIAAFAWILPATGHNRAELTGAGDFDASMLKIDEGRFLGQPTAEVKVRTEAGILPLRDVAAGQPTVLLLGYFACHGACPVTLRNLARTLHGVQLPEHQVLILSFDASDTLDNLRQVRADLGVLPANWTFGLLDRDDAKRLTESIGYRFFFSERDQTYLHPSVLVFLSPEGRIMRFLYGTDPHLPDLRLALAEASDRVRHLNDLVSMAKLVCYRYDPARSRYTLHPALLFGGAGLGVLALTGVAALTFKKSIQGVQS